MQVYEKMIQAFDNTINVTLIIPACLVVLILISYFRFKRNLKSIEFKVAVIITVLTVFVAEMAVIQVGILNNLIATAFLTYGPGIIVCIFTIYYTTKIISAQNKKILDQAKQFFEGRLH